MVYIQTDNLYTVYVQTSSFSTWTITEDNTVLPVTWLSFKAAQVTEGVKLTWATATEENSRVFVVERSFNGQDFKKIDSLKAAGNSLQVQHYSYFDKSHFPTGTEVVYYRLRQVDRDGTFSYSRLVAVRVKAQKTAVQVAAYPNPFKQTLNLRINGHAPAGPMDEVLLYSLDGKLLFRQNLADRKNNGLVELQKLPDLPTGIYLMKVMLQNHLSVFKVVRE